MKDNAKKHITELTEHYPLLSTCEEDIIKAFEMITSRLTSGGKLLICGNGGSAADAQHITGELMKSFLKERPVPDEMRHSLENIAGERGLYISSKLQRGLPAIALTGQDAFSTAFANDVDASLVFAQQVYALGNEHDVLLGISTSGSSANIIDAVYVAKAMGMTAIGLTGMDGGTMSDICDVVIKVPAKSTPAVQELHLPVYHALCAMLEEEIF